MIDDYELTAILETLQRADPLGPDDDCTISPLRALVGRIKLAAGNAAIGHPPTKAGAAELLRDLRGQQRQLENHMGICKRVAGAIAEAAEVCSALEARLDS